MIKEALELLFQKGKDERKLELLRVDGQAPWKQHYIDKEGDLQVIELTPGPRRITCTRLSDIIGLIKNAGKGPLAFMNGEMYLTVHSGMVRLVFDTVNGYEHAVLPLTRTKEMAFFVKRIKEPHLNADEFRSALRYELRKTMDEVAREKLTEQVSKIRQTVNAETTHNMDRADESMGTEIQKQTQSGGVGLPDEHQAFKIRPYTVHDIIDRHPIECILDPDTQTMRWRLVPLEHSVLSFWQAVTDGIISAIKDSIGENAKVHICSGDYVQQGPVDKAKRTVTVTDAGSYANE
jgi:hypothetical protein